jgi:hypothetical protein
MAGGERETHTKRGIQREREASELLQSVHAAKRPAHCCLVYATYADVR